MTGVPRVPQNDCVSLLVPYGALWAVRSSPGCTRPTLPIGLMGRPRGLQEFLCVLLMGAWHIRGPPECSVFVCLLLFIPPRKGGLCE